MHERLSRLLAGELPPEAEADLRARITADPSVGLAWGRMCALPELLAALPIEAPPSNLLARLHAMELPEEPIEAPEAALRAALAALAATNATHPAPFAPHPDEHTLDPELRRPVRRSPVPTAAPVRSPRLPTRSSARRSPLLPTGLPSARRIALAGLALATAALAGWAPSLLGDRAATDPNVASPTASNMAPVAPARASLDIRAGESLVEGDVQVRAGELDMHVNGLARVRVDPAAGLLMVPDHALAAPAALGAVAPFAPEPASVSASGQPALADRSASAAPPPAARRGVAGPAVTRGAVDPGVIVTVEVERGVAVVTSGSTRTHLAAGETRSFATDARPALAPESSPDPANVESPSTREDRAVASRDDLPRFGATLSRTTTSLGPDAAAWPSDVAADWGVDEVEAGFLDAETSLDGLTLLDLDCDAYPCVAVYRYDGDSAADTIRDAVGARFTGDTSILHVTWSVDTEDGGTRLAAVAIGGPDLPVLRATDRLDAALSLIAEELAP